MQEKNKEFASSIYTYYKEEYLSNEIVIGELEAVQSPTHREMGGVYRLRVKIERVYFFNRHSGRIL